MGSGTGRPQGPSLVGPCTPGANRTWPPTFLFLVRGRAGQFSSACDSVLASTTSTRRSSGPGSGNSSGWSRASSSPPAGRAAPRTSRHGAADCARTCRAALRELAAMPVLDAFYLTTDEKPVTYIDVVDLGEVFKRIGKKARKNTGRRVVRSSPSVPSTPGWRFTQDPPLLTRIDDATAQAVLDGVKEYADNCLTDELRQLLSRYSVAGHRAPGRRPGQRRAAQLPRAAARQRRGLARPADGGRPVRARAVRAARPVRAQRRADRPRPTLDADRQRHLPGLDDDRRAALPRPPVPRHEGQHRPGTAQTEPARRLRALEN